LKVERDIVILTRLNGVSKVEYQIDLWTIQITN
jgi:hypothetical protein